jgi:hypothetical protein
VDRDLASGGLELESTSPTSATYGFFLDAAGVHRALLRDRQRGMTACCGVSIVSRRRVCSVGPVGSGWGDVDLTS